MKKLYKFLIAGIAIAVAVAVGVIVYMELYKPLNKVFADLDASQVESVQVLLGAYEATLSEEEVALLIPKLNQVELVGRGTQEYREYDGVDGNRFHIWLTDGTEFYFSASNPFYIIDKEMGYKAEYRTCDDISAFYHEMIKKYFPD